MTISVSSKIVLLSVVAATVALQGCDGEEHYDPSWQFRNSYENAMHNDFVVQGSLGDESATCSFDVDPPSSGECTGSWQPLKRQTLIPDKTWPDPAVWGIEDGPVSFLTAQESTVLEGVSFFSLLRIEPEEGLELACVGADPVPQLLLWEILDPPEMQRNISGEEMVEVLETSTPFEEPAELPASGLFYRVDEVGENGSCQ